MSKTLFKALVFVVLMCSVCFAQPLQFSGNIIYTKQAQQTANANSNLEYQFKLFETNKYQISLSNALCIDLDCFKNEIKEANVFTTLKISF